MKNRLSQLLSAFLTLTCLCRAAGAEAVPRASAGPARCVIGLSPFLENKIKDDVYRRIVAFLLEEMPLGSSLWLCDAYRLQTITRVEVPDLHPFRSAKTRANQFKEPIHKLKEFLAAHHEPSATNTLKLEQAVRFPQFMALWAMNGMIKQRSRMYIARKIVR